MIVVNIETRKRMEEILCAQLSEDMFRDHDPDATAWWAAIHHVWRHQRKTKRKFLKLWMDDTQDHRLPFGMVGLSTVYSGGSSIQIPLVTSEKK